MLTPEYKMGPRAGLSVIMTSSDEWRCINSSEQALCLARKWASEDG
jgi:hypothetical protein